MSAHPTTMAARTDTLIESYVADVVRRLPARLRNDVAFELRALLQDELRGRAGDAGRLPDEAMTLDLLRGFGRPEDVAQRYHPPGVPIIPAQHSRAFALASAIGVALQWAVTLPMAAGSGVYNWLGAWWTSYGLGAFWWPGFLVTTMMIAAFVRRRWPEGVEAWSPRAIDRDRVSRPLLGAGLALALLGVAVWVALAWWSIANAGESPLARAFQFDAGFIALKAPVVLGYWALAIALLMTVFVEGRWRALTRRLEMALNLVSVLMLAWIAFAGPVFAQKQTDETTRGILALIAILIGLHAGWMLLRDRRAIQMPEALRARRYGP